MGSWMIDENEMAVDTSDLTPVTRCSKCKNLEKVSYRAVYAKCTKFNIFFRNWEDDTRENGCSWGEEREDGKID